MPEFQDISTVISMVPVAINETKPGLIPSQYHIKPCYQKGEFQVVHIARAKFAVYIDEARPALIVPEPSDRVAESICRDLKVSWGHYEPGKSEAGLFWIPGPHRKMDLVNPKDPMIIDVFSKAIEMQGVWLTRIIDEADEYWSRHRSRRMVSDIARAGAKWLGLKKEWDVTHEIEAAAKAQAAALSVCKFCKGEVHPEAIICKHCTGILDMGRYEKEFKKAAV